MSAGVEEALALLGGLEESDRSWILEHLSPAAKARLSGGIAVPRDRLIDLDAASVAEVLSTEPAWLVQAVLSAADGLWKAEVIGRLPANLRTQVDAMARRKVTLARPALDFLLRSLSERLKHDVQFDSLVLNFSDRGGQ